jgi:hypothetical protein
MKMNQWLVAASIAVVMSLGVFQIAAPPSDSGKQGGSSSGRVGGRGQRGNYDPAQMQQRILERYKDILEITNDDEWKAIEPRVQKIMDARRESFSGRTMFFGRGPRGGDNTQGDQSQQRRSSFFGAPSPTAEALQRAIDSKASKAELKAALEKYQAYRKEKQAELEKAQADLREVLTPRQEAIATLNGLL